MQTDILSKQLTENGFAHINDFYSSITPNELHKIEFMQYWNDLVCDENFKEYTDRERRILRYNLFSGSSFVLELNEDNVYKSSVTYDIKYKKGGNRLTYADDGFVNNDILQQIIFRDWTILQGKLDCCPYTLDIHQFRVKSEQGKLSPTTSGVHQDGFDWIFMHYINSSNTIPVISGIYENKEDVSLMYKTQMNIFLETLVVNDRRLYHKASGVQQLDPGVVAFRDLLLVTFTKYA